MRVAIEGLIGVGKSTVLGILASMGHDVELEPLSDWSLLPQFYANQSKNASAFEAQVLASYCHDKFSRHSMLMERSPDTALFVFARMLHQQGHLSGSGLQMLRLMYETMPIHKADAFVYIMASPDVCMRRMQWRARGSENNVGPEYLESLNAAYKNFLHEDPRPSIIVALDGSEGPEQVANLVRQALTRLDHMDTSHHIVFKAHN